MQALPKYERYKASSTEWLGNIPDHWELKKSKYLWRERDERSIDGEGQLLSVSQYSGVVPREEESRSESFENYKQCAPNDLVTNIMLAWMGGLGISSHAGIVSPAYSVYKQVENNNPNYLGYLYRTPIYLAEFARRSKGVVPSRWRMYTEDFGQVLTLLPPKDEQDRIVNFLDQKTTEIDEAIAKKQRLIELLKEQKAILINQAVTKGINPKVPMRDSGVEWIGEVPEHWALKKNRWICFSVRDGTHNPPPAIDGEHRLLSVRNIIDGEFVTRPDDRTMSAAAFRILQSSYHLELGDVVVALVGGTTGKSAVVKIDCSKISVQRSIGILRPIQSQVLPEFLNYAIQAPYTQKRIWEIAIKYAAQPGIYLDDLAKIRILCPPLQEQQTIVSHLNDLEGEFQKAFNLINQEIGLLLEYKASLVASSVMGKIRI